MMSLELAYEIAREMDLNGIDFEDFIEDCNNSDRAYEWKDEVYEKCSKEHFKAFCEECGVERKRVYQISIDILAPEEGFDPDEVLSAVEDSLPDTYEVMGWTQDTSWAEDDYM